MLRETDFCDFDRKTVIRRLPADTTLYAVALPYVDGAWQNFGEATVCDKFYVGGEWILGCLTKADIAVEPDIGGSDADRQEPNVPSSGSR